MRREKRSPGFATRSIGRRRIPGRVLALAVLAVATGVSAGAFAAPAGAQYGSPPQRPPGDTRVNATATFNVGSGATVGIAGGGSGTSNCTKDETITTVTTTSESEAVTFGFTAKGSGGCALELSWSDFQVTVVRNGVVVGRGIMNLGGASALLPPYKVRCENFVNLTCRKTGDLSLTIGATAPRTASSIAPGSTTVANLADVLRPGPNLGDTRVDATGTFQVAVGTTVNIVGGGGGTSSCTKDETNSTFTTQTDPQTAAFGFLAKSSGACGVESSWSDFTITAKSPTGSLLGSGKVKISGLLPFPYRLECLPRTFSGLSCQKTGDLSVTIKTA